MQECFKGVAVYVLVMVVAGCVGCSSNTQGAKTAEPPVVEVVQVEQKDVPILTEWIGTTASCAGAVNALTTGNEACEPKPRCG